MDHLPLPRNPTIGTFRIPFLCAKEYDGGFFMDYPMRNNWTIDLRSIEVPSPCTEEYDGGFFMDYLTRNNRTIDLQAIQFSKHCHAAFYHNGQQVSDEHKIGALMQTWLYLGLLCEVTGKTVSSSMFMSEDASSTLVFSSAKLNDLMGDWSLDLLRTVDWEDASKVNTWKTHINDCMLEAARVVFYIVEIQGDRHDSVLSRICLSIAVLNEAISAALKDVFLEKKLSAPNRIGWRDPDCGRPLVELMKQNGWCPNRIAYFDAQVANIVGMLWYYANLDPPEATDGHQRCTAEQCKSLQVDTATYETAHMEPDCKCSFGGQERGKLADAVTSGSFPLISLVETTTAGEWRVEVQRAEAATEFVAISHVWADGSGNSLANALPACVLLYIQERVNSLPRKDRTKPLPFWMDTLCLPVGPKELRKQALQNLNDPYKKARFVLVIDKYLRGLDRRGMTASETIARIVASGWHNRLWTFAEGRISKKVLFLFKDSIIDLVAIIKSHKGIPSRPANDIHMFIIFSYTATKICVKPGFDMLDIANIRTALSTRATSRPSDEALCLGVILGLDLKPIVEASDPEKMQYFWSLVGKVPIGITFSHTSRKLEGAGYRWAPASLMGDTNRQLWGGPAALSVKLRAQPTNDGLAFESPGIFLKARTDKQTESAALSKKRLLDICKPDNLKCGLRDLWLRDSAGNWFQVTIEEAWHQTPVDVYLAKEEPAFILEDTFANALKEDRPELVYGRSMAGVLVTCPSSEADGTSPLLHAKAHRHVVVQLISQKETKQVNALKTFADKLRSDPTHKESITNLQNQPLLPNVHRDWFREAIEDFTKRDDGWLLENGRETQRHRMLDASYDSVINIFCMLTTYFLDVEDWMEMEDRTTMWCVD